MTSDDEARDKGDWAATAQDGIVPAEQGGAGAPQTEAGTGEDELGTPVLGRQAADDEPATDGGIDLSAGDQADATTDGGPDVPEGAEPDLKDAPSAQRPGG